MLCGLLDAPAAFSLLHAALLEDRPPIAADNASLAALFTGDWALDQVNWALAIDLKCILHGYEESEDDGDAHAADAATALSAAHSLTPALDIDPPFPSPCPG
jgi:hypothetical protein